VVLRVLRVTWKGGEGLMVKEDDLTRALDMNRDLSVSNSQLSQKIKDQEQIILSKIQVIEKLEREIRDLNLLRILSQSGILRGMRLDVARVQSLVENLINSQLEPENSSTK
jgi:hypothetical protein